MSENVMTDFQSSTTEENVSMEQMFRKLMEQGKKQNEFNNRLNLL